MSFAAALPTLLSSLFYAAVVLTLWIRVRRRPTGRSSATPVTILKPIAGADADLADNLASFARLAHPRFELLLGFASAADPGVPIARAFLAAHPDLDARILFTREPTAATPNPKVAQLTVLERAAKFDVVVVSDANVRVRPDYLGGLLAELERPGVGLTTSLVVGAGEGTFGARLDAAQLVACVAPAVVAADATGLKRVAIGKSMAFRRVDLLRVGGLASVGNVLAEDDVLGSRFAAAGMGVTLCLEPIESRAAEASIATTCARHLRWARMRRAIAPSCLLFELAALPSVVGAVTVGVLRTQTSLALPFAGLALQILGASVAARALVGRPGAALRFALLEPARTALHVVCVAGAWSSLRVAWRGHTFRLGPGSLLVAEDAPPPSRLRRWLGREQAAE